VNDRAPIIDRHVFEAFRARPELRDRLRDAFKKMLWFYGFELHIGDDGKLVVSEYLHADCFLWDLTHSIRLSDPNWMAQTVFSIPQIV
jgi:hypothetical protein